MTVTVRAFESSAAGHWDDFVFGQRAGTFCHRAGWKHVIEKGAGQSCPYLFAEQDGAIVGVLPLTVKKHWLFGKALISNMFGVYGGAVAVDNTVRRALNEAAWQLALKNNLPLFESRDMTAPALTEEDFAAGWHAQDGAATFIRELAPDDETQMLAVPRKQRAVIRKSLSHSLKTEWQGSLDTFYQLYARSVHALGTPVFPKKLFAAFMHTFPDHTLVQITCDQAGDPVASLMSFIHQDTILPYYAGSNAKTRDLAAHDFMYYSLMQHARARGLSHFDFGRSRADTGPYRYKKNWGFEPHPLAYRVRIKEGATMSAPDRQSGAYAKLSKLWQKMPFALSTLLGPPLARHLG